MCDILGLCIASGAGSVVSSITGLTGPAELV